MRPNSRQLAMRDPAAAILLGALAPANGNFGHESNARFGNDFGTDFGSDNPWGAEFGHDPGYNFGFDHYGAEAAAVAIPKPTAANMMAAWNAQVQRHVANKKRETLLEPNKGADAKVERYAFPISQALTIGTGVAINLVGNPTVHIRPQRVVMNAPCPMFALITTIQVANVLVTVGPGSVDASDFSNVAVGTSMDMPTLTPANAARVIGTYSGLIPPGFTNGFVTVFTANFIGWASIVA